MTNKEALEILVNAKYCRNAEHEKLVNDAIETLKELVNKEIPIKPFRHNPVEIECTVCDEEVAKWMNYCAECGQKIDWSKDE